MKRDRDNPVTPSLPVLVNAYARIDGFIEMGSSIDAQILPGAAALWIFNPKKTREYREVYKKVGTSELTELKALALLVAAVGEKKHQWMKQYREYMGPLESNLAVTRLVKEMERWAGSGEISKEQEDLARAQALHNLQKRSKFPWHEMNWRLNEWLRKARVVIWLRLPQGPAPGVLTPGLYCEDMAAALAALLFFRVASPQAITICRRCGTGFIRNKRVQ